jgi:hypothetical protein
MRSYVANRRPVVGSRESSLSALLSLFTSPGTLLCCARRSLVGLVVAVLLASSVAHAAGHGPVYGLATPTLGKGSWSLDIAVMGMDGTDGSGHMLMLRPMVGYGITSDLQVSLSVPVQLYLIGQLARSRMMLMMPAEQDVELQLAWRFFRKAIGVGSRIETTGSIYADFPIQELREGAHIYPGLVGALVTGYASRSWYVWGGGLYRRYLGPVGDRVDHVGDTAMYSLVVGYRPPWFQNRELPQGDWRLFAEMVGEYSFRTQIAGQDVANTGGHRIFLGPTVLGLYGGWGISGGPQFAVYNALNGNQPKYFIRYVVNFTYWWF